MQFQYITDSFQKKILQAAHDIHVNPELSEQEYQTTELIRQLLQDLNIELVQNQPKTGAIGIIRGSHPGKTVALRADIDALPVQEDSAHQVVSKVDGIMHACGHDIHTAALLGAAMALNEKRRELCGNVLLIFQPAEEVSTGADTVIQTGVFTQYPPDAFFSLHVMPSIPAGKIGIRQGAIMAAQKGFSIKITGKGGHGASPHLSHDPLIAATRTVDALQTIASRQMDPASPFVLSVCSIHGGTAFNIIPGSVEITGTCRLLDNTMSSTVEQWITDIAAKTADIHSCQAETVFFRRLPALDNAFPLVSVAHSAAKKLYGEESIICQDIMMGSEDFSLYSEIAPIFMYHVGTGTDDGTAYPLHNCHFMVPDEITLQSAELMTQTALSYLNAKN